MLVHATIVVDVSEAGDLAPVIVALGSAVEHGVRHHVHGIKAVRVIAGRQLLGDDETTARNALYPPNADQLDLGAL